MTTYRPMKLDVGLGTRILAETIGLRKYVRFRRLIAIVTRRTRRGLDPVPMLEAHLVGAERRMQRLGMELCGLVACNLKQLEAKRWRNNDDSLFAPHTALVDVAIDHHEFLTLPIMIWTECLHQLTAESEQRIGRRIHKGAPLYNVGLCHFKVGDLVQAAQYIDAAGDEDELSGRTPGRALITGQGIAKRLLMDDLLPILQRENGSDYRAALGAQLTDAEFVGLVEHLSQRASDAILMLFGFWRARSLELGPDSHAAKLQRVRALADLLVSFESNLTHWQGGGGGTLRPKLNKMIQLNKALASAFNSIEKQYSGSKWDQASTLNYLVKTELARFGSATRRVDASASALYVTYRLRNSMMHVVEEQLDLMSDRAALRRVMGFALISIALSWRAAQGQLGQL
ncbi:MAG: hypothetical protein ABIE42_08475 [Candidatus Eisenbacteria bacterium]